jgi:molybdopterin/thiamine biosynthesis adenylyltransferase
VKKLAETPHTEREAELGPRELRRYERQLMLRNWGAQKQGRLKASTVFIAGAGGLGCAAGAYLAAAGAGRIRLCDSGKVEVSNLNRQFFYGERDVGRDKVMSAVRRILRINPHVSAVGLQERIDGDSVSGLVGNADIMVDCLDNFETRFVLNELSVKKSIPLIHAGVNALTGQLTFIHPPETPCLRCLFPHVPAGGPVPIIGAVAGVIGCLEALEAIKYLTGTGRLLKNRLLVWDGGPGDFEEIMLQRSEACPVCGLNAGEKGIRRVES